MALIAGSLLEKTATPSAEFTPTGSVFEVTCSSGSVSVLIQPPGSSEWFIMGSVNNSAAVPSSLIAGTCVPVSVDVTGSKFKLSPNGVATAAAWE